MMNRFTILILSVASIGVAQCTADTDPRMLCGIVQLMPHQANGPNVTGQLTIVQDNYNSPVRITGRIQGLPEGLHGFHVHEKGDLRDGCTSAGPHFNPEKVAHGAPDSPLRHVGDLGNIRAGSDGIVDVDITDHKIALFGMNNILGRAIVVHSDEDDLGKGQSPLSRTTGNAGSRLACGVVGVLSA
ncbi:uncharacterized protein LOC128880348 [Hylaeus volcanicus]|uniref:uncharacterized protein LOC128880348 n=1 Tax=Hylaeus volcanicus TaxID=313075 RepID=UPI0023B82DAF|nr:uncharacterized protein LOC128880348 [Hylaeus volcanicus]XP_053986324.1 uncharacterized protein LOC128880348 [Hylaeus volcanicus]